MAIVALVIAGISAACTTPPDEDPTTSRDQELQNVLDDGTASYVHKGGAAQDSDAADRIDRVNGLSEGITVTSTYSTSYDTTDWKITDSKTLDISVTVDAPEGYQFFVESMHADVELMSKVPATDGLTQDSMDDSLHSGDQPGFFITGHPYTESFVIEGTSDTFLDMYIRLWDGYGYGDLEEHRPTECEFRDKDDGKVKGNRFQIVFNLMVRDPGEEFFHKVTLTDEFKVELPLLDCQD